MFMCPHLSIWAGKSDVSPHRTMMYENILLVDEESYKSCSIKNGSRVKRLLTCDNDPMGRQVKYTNEKFASTQAHPDKQCYEQGNHYYFMSTSDGSMESLNNTEGGHCKTHHMKLHIYVCSKTEPCEFEMPECPKKKEENTPTMDTPTPGTHNCSDDSASVSAQTGFKVWFEDNRHPVFYTVMGLVILILFVFILWLLRVNRGYRKSESVKRKNEEKSSLPEKEAIYC